MDVSSPNSATRLTGDTEIPEAAPVARADDLFALLLAGSQTGSGADTGLPAVTGEDLPAEEEIPAIPGEELPDGGNALPLLPVVDCVPVAKPMIESVPNTVDAARSVALDEIKRPAPPVEAYGVQQQPKRYDDTASADPAGAAATIDASTDVIALVAVARPTQEATPVRYHLPERVLPATAPSGFAADAGLRSSQPQGFEFIASPAAPDSGGVQFDLSATHDTDHPMLHVDAPTPAMRDALVTALPALNVLLETQRLSLPQLSITCSERSGDAAARLLSMALPFAGNSRLSLSARKMRFRAYA